MSGKDEAGQTTVSFWFHFHWRLPSGVAAPFDAPYWGPPHWGHVTSTDLAHWTRHPDALSPDHDGPDADGCWSGCFRSINGEPAIYYTGVVGEDHSRVESVCRAWGNHDLTVWTKDPANPLIAGSPTKRDTGYHRDPFIYYADDRWHMLLGSGTSGAEPHGQVLRYESDDAESWAYAGVFFEAPRRVDQLDLGENWECPQIVFDGDSVVLLLSCQVPDAPKPLVHAVYFIGRVEGGAFYGHLRGVVDEGDVLYAPAVTVDGKERTLLWGWMQERLTARLQQRLSHVGALSLARVLSVEDDRLHLAPAPEIGTLRRRRVGPQGGGVVETPDGRCVEIAFTVTGNRGLVQWWAGGGDEALTVEVDLTACQLHLTVTDRVTGRHTFDVPISPGDVDVQLFIDGSLVELFVDGHAISTRFYTEDAKLTMSHMADGGSATISKIDMWCLDRCSG
jgi:beta-fructofuranosidase